MKTIKNAFLFSASLLLACSAYSNTYRLVSLTGDNADGEGSPTLEAFSTPRINDLGQVAFGARFTSPQLSSDFNQIIKPLFAESCLKCHGDEGDRQRNIDLAQIQSAYDLVIRPGALTAIRNRIQNRSMPPQGETPLDSETRTQALEVLNSLIEVSGLGYTHLDAVLQYENDQTSTLARTGEVTDIDGLQITLDSIRGIALTGDSDVAFVGNTSNAADVLLSASLRGEPASPNVELHITNSQQPIVDFAGNTDDSRRYQLIGNPSNLDSQAFSFISRLRDGQTPDASGFYIVDLPSHETDDLPIIRLAALGGISPNGGATVLEKPIALSVNASLESALLASIEDGDEIENNDAHGIWHLDASSVSTLIAKSGDTAPGSTDAFSAFGRPAIDGDGNVVFWASLLNAEEEEGLYRFDGALSALATSSSPIDIFGNDRSFDVFYDAAVNASGALAVLAENAGGEGRAILARDANGIWSIVAETGMTAPGTFGGIVFQSFSLPRINDAGQVAFQATLAGDGDAISDTTDSGIWALDSNGVLSLIQREGDTLEVREGFPATVQSFEIGGFNANGQIALRSLFTNGAQAVAIIDVEDVPPPSIAQQPSGQTSYDGESFVLSVTASGQGPFEYQWKKDGEDIEGATGDSLSIENASSGDDGNYTVVITSSAGSVSSEVAGISIQALPDAPAFVAQPLGDIALIGTAATLDARAVSTTPVTYQWYFENQPIDGATGDTLTINPATSNDEGSYYVVATSEGGSTNSLEADVLVTDKRLYNIAARSRVGSDANVLIAGFVVIGPDPKQILIRGVGPGLPENLDRLMAPRLELYNGANELIYSNEGWNEDGNDPDVILAAALASGAGNPEQPFADGDTALLVELEEGLYTAIIRSQNETSGIALVDAFEVSGELSKMINVSARAYVGVGDEVVIPGFVVDGDLPSQVLIRAIGPGLTERGVAGALQFPEITVFDVHGNPIASNDGWGNLWDPATINEASEIVRTSLLEEGSEDAALILELDPGLYTVKTSGENDTTGVALVEVFAIP